jgi:hypothetical protein
MLKQELITLIKDIQSRLAEAREQLERADGADSICDYLEGSIDTCEWVLANLSAIVIPTKPPVKELDGVS